MKGLPPRPPPPHRVSSKRDTPIHLSKCPVEESSSRFPKCYPYGKRCPSPELFLSILKGPQQGSPPSRFPSQSSHRERDRHFTSRAPFVPLCTWNPNIWRQQNYDPHWTQSNASLPDSIKTTTSYFQTNYF